ncbi:MAG: hypothetical protein HYX47_21650 [Burkholderiales bacterium]|nr:hypothetical protein [Burkholderiales bacterium]
MDQNEAEITAAQSLLAALDVYEAKFHSMVLDDMNPGTYEEVNRVLEQIRAAKLVIFRRVAGEAVEFLLAHSSLMTALWDFQLSRVRGTPSVSEGGLPGLTADHDEAVERLREACERIVRASGAGTRKPPAAPSVGF